MPEFSELQLSSLLETSEIRKSCSCRNRGKMTNLMDVLDMKMTKFGYRVDLIRERHVGVEDEAKIVSRGTELTGMISLPRDEFVRSENRRCFLVPIRRNSVFDGLRSNLFQVHPR